VKKYIQYILLLLVVFLSSTCKKQPNAPEFSNKIEWGETVVDSVSYYTIKISDSVIKLEGNEIIEHGHCWSTAKEPTINDNKTTLGKLNHPGTFTSELTSLDNNTTYYIRSYVTYQYGTVYGKKQDVKTFQTGKPKVITSNVTNITINSAKCGGTNDDGGLTITQRGVCWNTTGNPTLENNLGHTNDGSGTGTFTSTITGLTENTTYYVSAYATNEKGTNYGEIKEFTTIPITIPEVVTAAITNITATSATCGGNVTSDGYVTVTARGVCWNTTGNPTLENNLGHTNDGSGTGGFTSIITGLTEFTIYYVAAYATNEKGTAYGETKSFETNFFVDSRDGQEYAYIKIGNQTWMAENLNYQTPGSWWYEDDSANGDIYGRLYSLDAALSACPSGWHLPTDDEWKTLEIFLGMSQNEADDWDYRGTDEGEKMKSVNGWSDNGNGTNSSGFNALPGGHKRGATWNDIGRCGNWWTATQSSVEVYINRTLWSGSTKVKRSSDYNFVGSSVRCLKN